MKNAKAAAPAPEHGVFFVERLHAFNHVFRGNVKTSGELSSAGVIMGQKLVKRRIQQANGHGTPLHGPEEALEVPALERQKLFQGGPALLDVCGENHLPHVVNAVPLEEHVFRAA